MIGVCVFGLVFEVGVRRWTSAWLVLSFLMGAIRWYREPCTMHALAWVDATWARSAGLDLRCVASLGPSSEGCIMCGACTDTVETAHITTRLGSGHEGREQ